MRLISDLSASKPLDMTSVFETSTRRLREAIAILDAIDEGNLLAEISRGEEGGRQQCAVSLLALLERELRAVVASQEAHLARGFSGKDIAEHGGA